MPDLTPVVIANRAMAMIGADPLQSLDDETIGGQAARLLYDSLIGMCLGLTPWTFLRSTQLLNRLDVPPPANGFTYVHQLPPGAELLRLTRSRDYADVLTRFEIEGETITSDELVVYAQQQLDVTEQPHLWSAPFCHAFTTGLAADLALSHAHDKNLKAQLAAAAFGSDSQNLRGGLMGAAIQANSRNSPVKVLSGGGPLLDAWQS
jgi:hypothetical protein